MNVQIRQKPPFLYVDTVELVEVEQQIIITSVDFSNVEVDRYCCTKSTPSYLLIEAMAQSSAVLLRQLFPGSKGGLLVGISNAEFDSGHFELGEIKLRSQLILNSNPIIRFYCEAFSGVRLLVSAEIQIYLRLNDDE